jgi:hypothetical protein
MAGEVVTPLPLGWAELPLGTVAMCLFFGVVVLLYAYLELTQLLRKPDPRGLYEVVEVSSTAVVGQPIHDSKDEEQQVKEKEKDAATPGEKANVGRVTALDVHQPASVKALLQMGTQLGILLLYSWVCEFRPFQAHGSKHADRDQFWFLALVVVAVALLKVEKTATNELLNRDQTEEWKGWMQYIFLAYHYFNFADVYNSVRVFISCYVWMTGFGNFSFFYMKQDFSWLRFWNMMWRLNFLVFFLCLVHGNTYILYYICPLHTLYFCMVYLTMRVGQASNHSKFGIRMKLLALAAVIFCLWELPGMFNIAFAWLPTGVVIGAKGGTQHEFHFRTALDHWSAFFGMIFALTFPASALWFKKVEALPTGRQWLIKSTVGVVLSAGAYYYAFHIYPLPKLEYNELHPYVFLLPILAYVFLRNISVTLRTWHCHYLAEMGKITLETYLMQHHIWLTSNAKTLLVLIPEWPLVNMFVTTLLYAFISKKLYRITIGLRAMLIPEDFMGSLVYLMWMAAVLAQCFFVAMLLQANAIVSLEIIVLVVISGACGVSAFFKLRSGRAGMVDKAVLLCSLFAALIVVAYMWATAPDFVTPPAPKARAEGEADGVGQSVQLGLLLVGTAVTMLFTFDNFFGVAWAASQALSLLGLGDVAVTFEEAYEKLNASIRNRGKA